MHTDKYQKLETSLYFWFRGNSGFHLPTGCVYGFQFVENWACSRNCLLGQNLMIDGEILIKSPFNLCLNYT